MIQVYSLCDEERVKNKTATKSTEFRIKAQHVWQNADSKISYTAL